MAERLVGQVGTEKRAPHVIARGSAPKPIPQSIPEPPTTMPADDSRVTAQFAAVEIDALVKSTIDLANYEAFEAMEAAEDGGTFRWRAEDDRQAVADLAIGSNPDLVVSRLLLETPAPVTKRSPLRDLALGTALAGGLIAIAAAVIAFML